MNTKDQRIEELENEIAELSHALSHDLTAPVRHIIEFSRIIIQSLPQHCDTETAAIGKKTENDEVLTMLEAAGTKLRLMLNGLRKLTRIHTHDLEKSNVDPEQLLLSAFQRARAAVPCEATFTISGRFPPLLYLRAPLFEEIGYELMVNALVFRAEYKPTELSIHMPPTQHGWDIHFTDNGIGIDNDYAADAYRIFSQLDPHKRAIGVGIGLSFCSKAAASLGGAIRIEPTAQGTNIILSLPIEHQAAT